MRRITDFGKLPRLDVSGPERPGTRAASRTLHLCPQCGSSLVQPTRWEQGDERGQWRVWRRCPECEWRGGGLHDEAAVEAYDEQLDNGVRELVEELRTLQHANMRDLADAFITALQRDLIDADDFVRGR